MSGEWKEVKTPAKRKFTGYQIEKRRDGKYTIKDGDRILMLPSVTTVLNVINKPALLQWAGGQVYDALMRDSNLNRQAAVAAIYTKRDKAANVGSLVHSWAESIGKGASLDLTTLPEEAQGFGVAFQSFLDTHKPTFLKTEQIVYSVKHGYAGTLDAIIQDQSGTVWLIDFKTSKSVDYPEYGLQLSAYKSAVEEMDEGKINKQAILHLKPNGTFTFHEKNEPFIKFWSCLQLYKSLNDLMTKQEIDVYQQAIEYALLKIAKGKEVAIA